MATVPAFSTELPAYDPYGAQAKADRAQAEAADPQVAKFKKYALKKYWECVSDFNSGDLEAAQRAVGPQCNRAWVGWFKGVMTAYRTDHNFRPWIKPGDTMDH